MRFQAAKVAQVRLPLPPPKHMVVKQVAWHKTGNLFVEWNLVEEKGTFK